MYQLSSIANHVQSHASHTLWPLMLLIAVFVLVTPLAWVWSGGGEPRHHVR